MCNSISIILYNCWKVIMIAGKFEWMDIKSSWFKISDSALWKMDTWKKRRKKFLSRFSNMKQNSIAFHNRKKKKCQRTKWIDTKVEKKTIKYWMTLMDINSILINEEDSLLLIHIAFLFFRFSTSISTNHLFLGQWIFISLILSNISLFLLLDFRKREKKLMIRCYHKQHLLYILRGNNLWMILTYHNHILI